MKGITLSLTLLVCFWGLTTEAQAQLPPSSPFSPSDPKECQKFAADVERYAAEISKQHDQCLATHKADRPNEQPNSMTCSRSACQNWHDILYGDRIAQIKYYRQQATTCNNQANEKIARQAREKQEEARIEAQIKSDAERAQNDERESREAADRARSHATPAPQKSNASTESATTRAAVENKQVSSPRVLPNSPASKNQQPSAVGSMKVQETPEQERARLAAREREKQERKEEVLQEMADPYGQSGRQVAKNKSDSPPEGVVDPYANADRKSRPLVQKDEVQEYSLEVEEKAVETGMRFAGRQIDKDYAAASKVLNSSDLKVFGEHCERTRSVVDGFGRALKVVHYGKDLGLVIVANDDRERARAGGDLFLDIAKDGFISVVKRISSVGGEVLGKFATVGGEIAEGPVGWVAGSLFDSTEERLDPMAVLNSSRFSFQQKQKALDELYTQYDHHKEIWGKPQVQDLMRLTKQLYESPDNPNIHLTPP